jgi:hypothetical protein
MGKEWKNHKYIRKEGKRYFYKDTGTSVEDLSGIESPDLQGFADSLGNIEPVKKLRGVMDMKIYSPNKEDKTLITEAKAKLDELIDQNKDKKLLAGGK